MADRVLDGFLREFAKDFGFSNVPSDELFEHFVNYLLIKRIHPGILDPEDLSMGKAAGIDGIAIFVNERLVMSNEDIDFFKSAHVYLRFVFIQSKTSTNFDMGDMSKFVYAVEDFFRDSPRISPSERISECRALKKYIFNTTTLASAPTIELFYVTTGAWHNDATLKGLIDDAVERLKSADLSDDAVFKPIDGSQIKEIYRSYKKNIERTIPFYEYTTLPKIEDVEQAFIGILNCREFLKLICDSDGNLLRSVFSENVRDYQGNNRVNEEIRQTVSGKMKQRDKFVLLNNGITIVAKSTTTKNREMTLRDYQIVNGCQTSHILYLNKDELSDHIHVPVKLIATTSQELTNAIIKASNWQTEIRPEAFENLEPFHRALEEFYGYASPPSSRLYYERRSKQHFNAGIPDNHVISIANQTTSFVAMFLDEPHHCNDTYYSKLLEKYCEDKREIFAEDHDPYPYFISGFASFIAKSFLRSGELDQKYKKFLYHMLLGFRIKVGGPINLPNGFRTSKKLNEYCDKLKNVLFDRPLALNGIRQAAEDVDEALNMQKNVLTDVHKRKYFTTDLISLVSQKPYSALLQGQHKRAKRSRPVGVVSRFGSHGYGFIEDEDGNSIFVHGSEVRGKKFCDLQRGQRVEFTPVYVEKGFTATDVVLLGDSE